MLLASDVHRLIPSLADPLEVGVIADVFIIIKSVVVLLKPGRDLCYVVANLDRHVQHNGCSCHTTSLHQNKSRHHLFCCRVL